MNASTTTQCIVVPPDGTALVVSAAALTAAKGIGKYCSPCLLYVLNDLLHGRVTGGSAIVVWILVALCGMACAQVRSKAVIWYEVTS